MRRTLSLAVALVAIAAGSLPGQTVLPPEKEEIAVEAMSRLKSPYTPFHTVDMCPSAPALRDSIRVMALNGMSTEAIVEDVVSRHGEQLRILPKRSGAGLWAWLAPPLLVIAGALFIARRFRRDGGEPPLATAGGGNLSERERGELAAALREYERRGEVDP